MLSFEINSSMEINSKSLKTFLRRSEKYSFFLPYHNFNQDRKLYIKYMHVLTQTIEKEKILEF